MASQSTFVLPRLSAMMFLEFFVWGAWYVTMGPYMTAMEMDEAAVGWAYSVGPIAAIISPFFLGMIADRYFSTERVLGALHLIGGVLLAMAPVVGGDNGTLFVTMIFLHMLCYMPTLGLTNTLAFHNIQNQEKQFPIIRVFGTVGWIVANLVISGFGFDTSANQFYVAGAFGMVLGVFSFMLPHTPPPAAGQKASARTILGLDAIGLMKRRSFAVLIVCSFLLCIPLAAYYSWGGVFVGDQGITNIAQTMSYGQMAEVVFMLLMPLFFAALGAKWMLAVGMLAWVVRYGLFAGAARSDETMMWMIIGGIALHGICYDFFFVTGQIYVDKVAPANVRGQAQGFLVLVTQGLGMLIGAQVSAALVKGSTDATSGERDWFTIWIVPCVMAGIFMVAFIALFKDRSTGDDASLPEPVPEGTPSE